MNQFRITIRSGGQTGADRAALDAAIELGLPHGGWCPKGRKAEDGRIASFYQLRETRTSRYAERTRLNIEDSDATVIFSRSPLFGGTSLTATWSKRLEKPFIVIDPGQSIEDGARLLREFIEAHGIRDLNVAGPRLTTDRTIYEFTKAVLTSTLAPRSRDRRQGVRSAPPFRECNING